MSSCVTQFLIDVALFVSYSSPAFRNLKTIRSMEGWNRGGEVKGDGGDCAVTGFLSHIPFYKSHVLRSSFCVFTFAQCFSFQQLEMSGETE